MPDPNVTLTAIETHAAALEGASKRHAANAGRCKVWSGAIFAGVMVFAAMKPEELEAWQRDDGVAVCGHVHNHDSAGG